MNELETRTEVYQLHVWIRQISPMIWRRVLVRSDSTIEDLHYTLQIAFEWSDDHLNRFHIHGKDYGVYHVGGMIFQENPTEVLLCDFKFRKNECFLYEYDFGDGWRHEVRVEKCLVLEEKRIYPFCINGKRRSPPEDCGGPLVFMAKRDALPSKITDLFDEIQDCLETNDQDCIQDLAEEIEELHEWMTLDKFDRRAINIRLKQYATNDENWMWR